MRNNQLSKIQEVRVDQSLGRRMLSLSDIALETSGETSRLEMASIERARSIARESIAVSQGHGNAQARGKP